MKWGWLAITACTACSGARAKDSGPPTAASATKPPGSVGSAASSSAVSAVSLGKVRWRMLAPERFTARDELELSKTETLYVGEGGERWLVTTKPAPTADDPEAVSIAHRGAATYAPEALVAARKKSDGRFALLGVSGAVYEAAGPLEDVVSKRNAPTPMRAVAAGKQAMLGLARKGELLRTNDFGVTWAPVPLAKTDRPSLRLVMNARGEALLLGAPNALLASVDDGATFAPVLDPGIGPSTVAVASTQELVAVGWGVRANAKTPDGILPIAVTYAVLGRGSDAAPVLRPKSSVSTYLSMPYPQGVTDLGYGDLIPDGRGALLGTRWVELSPDGGDEQIVGPKLVIHDLAGAPIAKLLPKLGQCDDVLLASSGTELALGCLRNEERKNGDSVRMMTVHRSTDLGTTLIDEGKVEMPLLRRMWLVSSGVVVADGGEGLRVRIGKSWVASKLPVLDGSVLRVAGTRDGSRLYVVYALPEGTSVLLVSKDSGKTFERRSFPQVEENDPSDGEELLVDESTKPPTVVVFMRAAGLRRFATQNDGATFDVQPLPFDSVSFSLAGKRGLAATGPTEGWETADAGKNWSKVWLPPSRGGYDYAQLGCSPDGCIVGTHAARLGWELEAPLPTVPEKPLAQPTQGPPAVAAFYECTTSGEPIATIAADAIPIDREGHAWYGIDRTPPKGGANVVVQERDGKAPKTIVLLAESKDDVGTWEVSRAEGAMAARHVLVRDKAAAKAPVDVEVAWWVAATGKVHRAKLEKAANPDPAKLLYAPSTDVAKIRATGWIVPGSGALIRLHTTAPPSPTTAPSEAYWITEAGKVIKVPFPATMPNLGNALAVRVGKTPLLLATNDDGWGFVGSFGELEKGLLPSRFVGLWGKKIDGRELRPRTSVTTIAGVPHLVTAWPGDDDLAPRTWALPVKDLGEPGTVVSLPTLTDLGTPPRACDAKSFAGARVELGWARRRRVAVRVSDGARVLRLASWETLSHAGSSPCVGAWSVFQPDYAGDDRAILLPSDPTHATLFAARGGKGERALVAKRMSCALSTAPVPATYASAKGFD